MKFLMISALLLGAAISSVMAWRAVPTNDVPALVADANAKDVGTVAQQDQRRDTGRLRGDLLMAGTTQETDKPLNRANSRLAGLLASGEAVSQPFIRATPYHNPLTGAVGELRSIHFRFI